MEQAKRMRKLICGILAALLLLAVVPFSALGANGSTPNVNEMSEEDKQAILDKQAELEDINKEIKDLQSQQNRITSQQKDLNGQIKQKQNDVVALEEQVAVLDEQITTATENIRLLSEEIGVKEADLTERTDYLNDRLYTVYVEGEVSIWDVLFSSTSLTDFLTRYDLMSKVVDQDVELLNGLKVDRVLLDEDKYELEVAKETLEADKKAREEKAAELKAQQGELEERSSKLSTDLKALEAALDEQEAATKEIQKFVKSIQDKYKVNYMGEGTMGWPLASYTRITSPYGYRNHPILKKRKFHSGVDIAAPKETSILAAETGKVIMATTYGSYGKTVIIDHGGGVSTQYAHMNSIGVSVGDVVAKGQRIGGVGTTGLSTGNHLHFMIMIDGKTIDPMGNGKYYIREP